MKHMCVERRASGVLLPVMLLVLFAGCASRSAEVVPRESWDPASLTEVRSVPVAELREALQARLDRGAGDGLSTAQWRRLRAIYAEYDHAPLFLERRGAGKRAEALVKAIVESHDQALDAERYRPAELQRAMRAAKERNPSAEHLADADVTFAAAYLRFGDDLLTGQVEPRSVNPDWRINPRSVNIDSILVRTLRLEPLANAIAHLRPQNDEYQRLAEKLAEYRRLVGEGGWGTVPAGETLKPRDTSTVARLAALRNRLSVEGYVAATHAIATVPGDTARAIYDETLAGAVAGFQQRHAIDVDSILGPGTIASLNVPAEYRLGQIAANMERLRWLPRELGDRYIYVNVPAFRLDAHEQGQPALSMRVIVGAEYRDRATPAFADSMSYLEFAPYWNVPDNIANSEIWPKVQADPGYLERNNYEVVVSEMGPRIRQRPGRSNALGLVKFMFPNEFNIYLHHTPQEELFEEDIRAFSHGCIRVEKPVELAEYVLARQGHWNQASIREAMEGSNRRVDLEEKIPVYIVYLTTFVREGELYFGNDIYDRDGPLVRAMEPAAQPGDESAETLALLRKEADGGLLNRIRDRLRI